MFYLMPSLQSRDTLLGNTLWKSKTSGTQDQSILEDQSVKEKDNQGLVWVSYFLYYLASPQTKTKSMKKDRSQITVSASRKQTAILSVSS